MLPSQYIALNPEERAFVIAAIQIKMKKEKDEAERLKK